MKRDERGIALVITLFLMASLSALAVSMMFLSQTETASSRNYRTMSQARYAAEAGVHEMTNYLMNTGFVPSANIDANKSPVTCTGGGCAHTGSCSAYSTIATAVANGCVVLGYSAATSNNPSAAYHTPSSNTLAVNGSGTTTNTAMGTVTFGAAAVLLSQQTITPYGSSTASTLQTWYIISEGTVPPSSSAIVEVSATMERGIGQAETFAVFATDPNCGAITLNGGGSDMTTDSYSSQSASDMSTTPPTHTGQSGGIGTNGNLNVSGHLTIGGTLTTPRTGSGVCNNSNPNAITGNGNWTYGGTVPIGQPISYPTPDPPSPTPPTTNVTISSGLVGISACNAALLAAGSSWTCSSVFGSPNTVLLKPPAANPTAPLSLGNVSVASNTDLRIGGGSVNETVNLNSFSLGSNGAMSLDTGTNVKINIAGNSLSGSQKPLDLSGGGNVNTAMPGGYDPYRLQFTYAGTAEVVMVGNNAIAATIYAPNALMTTNGTGNLYGSVLAGRVRVDGGASVHYDTSLSTRFKTLGNYVLTSFSWKKY